MIVIICENTLRDRKVRDTFSNVSHSIRRFLWNVEKKTSFRFPSSTFRHCNRINRITRSLTIVSATDENVHNTPVIIPFVTVIVPHAFGELLILHNRRSCANYAVSTIRLGIKLCTKNMLCYALHLYLLLLVKISIRLENEML